MTRAIGLVAIRHYRLCATFVLGLMAVNTLAGLGSRVIDDSDEALYGVSAYEMLRSHSFVVQTYAGQPDYLSLKPPLGDWVIAVSYQVFGPTALALRLPSALSAIGVVALTMAAARRWFNRRVGILSGLIMATAFPFLSHHGARSGDLDAPLTWILLLAATQVALVRSAPTRIVALAFLLSCGFLVKSFGILPMALVVIGFLLWTGAWRKVRGAQWALAGLVFVLPVAAWAFARIRADGSPAFLLRMVRVDLFARATQVIDVVTSSRSGPIEAFVDRFAPWPFIMLVATLLWMGGHHWRVAALGGWLRRGVHAFLVTWAAVQIMILSFMRTQHHWYLDPIYPACAMLASLSTLYLLRRSPARQRAVALVGLVVLPLVFCEVRVVARISGKSRMPDSQRFLESLALYRADMGDELYALFPLWHSERFILEVEDGLRVTEVGDTGAAARAVLPPGACVLASQTPRGGVWRLPADAKVLFRTDTYVVYRLAQ
jgi:4-amino-4-deoxy-L-arabinose transferase-like glycosyltransferase